MFDQDARFRESFDLASFVHTETTPPFDAVAIDADVTEQLWLIQKGRAWFSPKSTDGEGTAFVVGMPRSGSTLLEQMLDRHPFVGGIGEYDGAAARWHGADLRQDTPCVADVVSNCGGVARRGLRAHHPRFARTAISMFLSAFHMRSWGIHLETGVDSPRTRCDRRAVRSNCPCARGEHANGAHAELRAGASD